MISFPRFIRSLLLGLFFAIYFPPPLAYASTQLRYEIPLTMRAGLPVIEAELPGENIPLRFVFDTGADVNVIEKQVAKRLKLDDSSRGKIVVNGTIKEDLIKLTNVKFGNLTIPTLDVVGVNFNSPSITPDKFIDGILGLDVLRDFDMTVDVPTKKLILEKPTADTNRFEGSECFSNAIGRLRSWSEPRSIYADILLPHKDLEGQFAKVHAYVDTGAAITILNWHAAKAIGLMPGDPSLVKSEKMVRGLDPNGRTETYFYELQGLKFGTSQIGPLKVIISDVAGFSRHGMDGKPGVLLGIDVLKQQRLIISQGGGRLCFGGELIKD